MANPTTKPRQSTLNSDRLKDLLAKLNGVKPGAGGWLARCPAHEDKQQSLGIGNGEEGRILLKCYAGCTTEAVVARLGLTMSDLFTTKPTTAKSARRSIVATYDYQDENGKLLFQAVRYKPKGFNQRSPDGQGGYVYKLDDVRRVLYCLPRLLAADPRATVFICEGEKDADRLNQLGLIATTNSQGAGSWRTEYSETLRGRDVVILPDNDPPGLAHAEHVASTLEDIAASIKVLTLPDLPQKGDVSNWLDAGGDAEQLCVLAEGAPEWKPLAEAQAEATQEKSADNKSRPKNNAADFAINLARNNAEFFHDDEGEHFASVRIGTHLETYSLDSKAFKVWLSNIYFNECDSPLYGEDLNKTVETLHAVAQFRGVERSVFLRLVEYGGNVYFDLCNREWEVVEITPDGWRVITAEAAPVRFVRRNAMQALSRPVAGGTIDELRQFLNAEDDDTWTLIVSWLVMCFHPSGPYPVLSVCGEQGSAKTTTCKILRALIDPNKAPLRAAPKEERDLMIAASNSWLLGYDNLSGVSQDLSDSLCRIATGAGFATRALYTNTEETILSVKRPILINGIDEAAERSDLLDRAVSIHLPAIPDNKRCEEGRLWPTFDEAKPRILGALLTAASYALKHRDEVTLERKPRMADFARWATAAEKAFQLSDGAFMQAYDGNREASHEMALEVAPAAEVKEFIESLTDEQWNGNATQLLNALNLMLKNKGEDPERRAGWPQAGHKLTQKLRRVAPNLRSAGIEINFGRTNAKRSIEIRRQKLLPKNSVTSVTKPTTPIHTAN